MWHANVSWPPSELIRFLLQSVDSPHFGGILEQIKFRGSGHFLENAWWECPEICHVDVS